MLKFWIHFYEEVYPVRAFDIDFNNRLKISSVLNYMQDSASKHAEKLNVGYNDIINKNLFWVLYWVKVSVDFYPGFGDLVRVKPGLKQVISYIH